MVEIVQDLCRRHLFNAAQLSLAAVQSIYTLTGVRFLLFFRPLSLYYILEGNNIIVKSAHIRS